MTKLDLIIQKQRINVVKRFLFPGASVLDLGCADGSLFKQIPEISGIGIDPTLSTTIELPNATLLPGRFPQDLANECDFDFVTMLAVLEHLPRTVQSDLEANCDRVLKRGGKVIVTVPSASTDALLSVLKALRLIDGMCLEEHYGYDVRETPRLFPSFKVIAQQSFQLGFNNLFVLEKSNAHFSNHPGGPPHRGPSDPSSLQ